MAAPLAVAVTVSTGDTVVEEGTVLVKRAPDSTSDYTAASWKDPAWGHPEKDKKKIANQRKRFNNKTNYKNNCCKTYF